MTTQNESTEEILKNQKLVKYAVLHLYEQLCDQMHPATAFESLFYAWADIAMIVSDKQPKFYEKFNKHSIPAVLSLILSKNRDTTAALLVESLQEKIDKNGA